MSTTNAIRRRTFRRVARPCQALGRCLRVLATGLMVACHPTPQGGNGSPAPDPGPTTVEIDNRGFPDMTIYAVNGGQRERLGLAMGHRKTTLTIPAWLIRGGTTLTFLCDPVGSPALPVTEQLGVYPGDVVSLIILDP